MGNHTITATFSGTTEIAGSSGTFDQVVEKAPTVVVLTTAPDPSTFGQLVTLTAQVTEGGNPLGEGTVAFSEGGTVFCEESPVQADGSATCPTDDLTVGTHTITATFSGTDDYAVNDDTDAHVVNQAATTVTLSSSSNPAAYGLPVTFTATVAAGADPVDEGTVTIFVDGTPQQIDSDVDAAGQVTYSTSTLLAGSHTIRAEYNGTTSYLDAVSTDLQQQVVILADAGGPYTIAEGASLTLDASGSSPTGDYQWDLDDDGVFGDATGVDPTLTWTEPRVLRDQRRGRHSDQLPDRRPDQVRDRAARREHDPFGHQYRARLSPHGRSERHRGRAVHDQGRRGRSVLGRHGRTVHLHGRLG